MALLGGGSVLAGMVLGSMAVFIIDHNLKHAAVAAFVGAALADPRFAPDAGRVTARSAWLGEVWPVVPGCEYVGSETGGRLGGS